MGLRFAGHEGGRVAEALSLPLVIAVRPLGFCGSVIGRFAAVWAIGPRPWIPVGLSDCLGAGDLSLNVIGGRWRCFAGARFPNAFGGALACSCLAGFGVRSRGFLCPFWSKQIQTGESCNEARGSDGVAKGLSWRPLGPIQPRMQAPFAHFKAVLRPARAVACESAALGCLPSRWEEITGSAPRSRRRAIVERAQCVVRRMPCGVLLMPCFPSSFFSDRRAWNRRRRWLAALGPFIAVRNVEFNGRVGANRQRCAFLSPGRPPVACALIFAPPPPPPRQSPWRLAAA